MKPGEYRRRKAAFECHSLNIKSYGKHEIQSVKQSITFTQDEVDTLKEKAETNVKEM